ncbi:energy-coupling factor ABC transporter ATP-binding protein [Fusobacteria bacterium ZRK30]|nr:energy-coupling factor ABC transporter ATP-binding protein [Fusobacteria bacterium ZRK30]
MDIKLKNINFKYRNRKVLQDINLDIKKGESVALIGPNGSGKSTFLKLLNGLVIPNSGEYLFDNEIIDETNLKNNKFSKKFHKKIGFVFQNSETQLFCSSVYEEVAFGPEQMGFKESEIKERVEDCLNLMGVYKLKDEVPYNISGGEKKRVAIASMLAMNPDVITLDEPLNAIDPKCKKFLKKTLIELNQSGKTIICATHDFEYTEGLFDRVIVFSEDHKIIRDEKYDDLIMDRDFLRLHNII